MSCPGLVNGQTMRGEYHLILIEGDKIINEITLPPDKGEFITNTIGIVYRQLNKIIDSSYGGPESEIKAEAMEMSKVHLLDLTDVNGDGVPYEFQIIVFYASCGHVEVLTGGYSPKRDKAIIFPIIGINPTEPYYWHDNFFTDENGTVNYEFTCGDHGNEIYRGKKFEFNQTIEAFVLTEFEQISCEENYKNRY
jgi:hypothetical protein